jgi:hypothetical protein
MSKFRRYALLCLSFGLAVGLPVASLTPIVKAQTPDPSNAGPPNNPGPVNTVDPTSTPTAKPRHSRNSKKKPASTYSKPGSSSSVSPSPSTSP